MVNPLTISRFRNSVFLIYLNWIPKFVIVEWHFFSWEKIRFAFFLIMMAFFNESHLFDMVSSHANIKAIARRWQKMLRLNLNCVIGLSLHTISQIPDAHYTVAWVEPSHGKVCCLSSECTRTVGWLKKKIFRFASKISRNSTLLVLLNFSVKSWDRRLLWCG